MAEKEWRRVSQNAWMLDHDFGRGFYIVYQYFPLSDTHETTLVRRKSYNKHDDEHFVLVGDYRTKFKEIFPKGYKACMDFYCSFPIRDPLSEGKRVYKHACQVIPPSDKLIPPTPEEL